MHRNPRDIYGDGHGFVAVSQGGPPSRGRLDGGGHPASGRRMSVEIRTEPYRFNFDMRALPREYTRPTAPRAFLGLYEVNGTKECYIIWVARREVVPRNGPPLRFVTREGSESEHYLQDPIAWAELPAWQ